ncbi:hypothetical protein GWI33_018075 [Rhynchophorus ferrugineus]|uniref:Uncharacterized protein n=1 Tax=Rhynchophorus ferrugineus TaxID=354439 RepID=A0A834M1R7_RHYFE|nr:hypothetical protein GWI33_018075 [Rhynchophorus ferrugineus]
MHCTFELHSAYSVTGSPIQIKPRLIENSTIANLESGRSEDHPLEWRNKERPDAEKCILHLMRSCSAVFVFLFRPLERKTVPFYDRRKTLFQFPATARDERRRVNWLRTT